MIQKRWWCVVLLLLLMNSAIAAPEQDCLYYFQAEDCEQCQESEAAIESLLKEHPNLKVSVFEVYQNRDNLDYLQSFFAAYSIPENSQAIPVVFMHDSYFIGVRAITDLLPERIEENKNTACPSLHGQVIGLVGSGEPHDVFETLTFPVLTTSALADITQVLGLVVILLGILLVAPRNQQLRKGMVFIGSLYVLLSLSSFLPWSVPTEISMVFTKLLGIIGVGVGGTLVVKFIWPEKIKIVNNKFHKIGSVSSMVIIGLITSVLLLPSLNTKVFGTMRNLLTHKTTVLPALPLLLYYNLILVLILVVTMGVYHYVHTRLQGKVTEKEEKAEMWEKHYQKITTFFVGIIMAIMGFLTIIF